MRYATECALVGDGIRMHPGYAVHAGLRDGAACWGTWILPRDKMGSGQAAIAFQDIKAEDLQPRRQGPHMYVSAIHPDMWPAVFGLEVRVKRSPGAMFKLFSTLNEIGVNLLAVNTSADGYGLRIFNASCELSSLSVWAKQRLEQIEQHAAKQATGGLDAMASARYSAIAEIGRTVFAAASSVAARVRIADAADRRENGSAAGFLHDSTLLSGSNPWFLRRDDLAEPNLLELTQECERIGVLPTETGRDGNAIPELQRIMLKYLEEVASIDELATHPDAMTVPSDDVAMATRFLGERDRAAAQVLRDEWRRYKLPAIAVRPMLSLAYARVWEAPSKYRVRFRYDAGSSMLVCNDSDGRPQPRRVQQVLRDYAGMDEEATRAPLVALSYMNYDERAIRIRFMRRAFAREVAISLKVLYEWDSGRSGLKNRERPAGLLEVICDAIRDRWLADRIDNAVLKSTDRREVGRIEIVAVSLDGRVPDIDAVYLRCEEVAARVEKHLGAAFSVAGEYVPGGPRLIVHDVQCKPLVDAVDSL